MAGAHKKAHPLFSGEHTPGTASSIVGTNGAGTALVELLYGTAAIASRLAQRDAGGHLLAPSGATGAQVPNVDQVNALIAAALQGLSPKEAVDTLNVISDLLSAPPGSPNTGDAYVLSAAGTGGWSAFSAGDLVVWDGAAWQLVVANSGGSPPDGTRMLVTGLGSGTAAGSFAGQADAIATYSGGTPSFEAPQNGWSVLVRGANEPKENQTYVYDSTPGGWVQHTTGATDHNSTTGLQGGTVGEYYHLTQAEQIKAAAQKDKITLAGSEPVPADFTTLTQSLDWAWCEGTTGEAYLAMRLGSNYHAVELSQVTT